MGQLGQGFDKPNPEGRGSGQPSQTNPKLSRQFIFSAEAVSPSYHAGSIVDKQRYDEADEMALVVRPDVVITGANGKDVVAKGGDSLSETEFQEDGFPRVSFEGHGNEALKLFSVIVESWRDGAPKQDVEKPVKNNGKGVRELRKLECSINYDRSKGGDGRRARKAHGNQGGKGSSSLLGRESGGKGGGRGGGFLNLVFFDVSRIIFVGPSQRFMGQFVL
ncbi:hypothetical protein CsSME_00046957 [Camellia sinensis var. sinensis]